jgi:hypothetical protein
MLLAIEDADEHEEDSYILLSFALGECRDVPKGHVHGRDVPY